MKKYLMIVPILTVLGCESSVVLPAVDAMSIANAAIVLLKTFGLVTIS